MAITNNAGVVVERLAYDPWGKRRFVNGNPDKLDAITGQYIDRGFTMHEHIDEMGIINMNGRIYDPLIGRFMSADPYIQAPTNLQSFNRYAYVWNNPLNNIDPSGFSAWTRFRDKILKPVIAGALDYFGCSGFCTMALNAYSAARTRLPDGSRCGLKCAGVSIVVTIVTWNLPVDSSEITRAGVRIIGACAASAAAQGSCRDGAYDAATIVVASGIFGAPLGAAIAGCANATRAGRSCGVGARDGLTDYLSGEIVSAGVNYVTNRGSPTASASPGSSGSGGGGEAGSSNPPNGSNLEDRITVNGGTAEQQLTVNQSIKNIGSTSTGVELNSAIPAGNITVNIVPGPGFTASGTLGPPYVTTISTQFIDGLVCCYVDSKGGLSSFTLDRILAHELGHHTGLPDFGTPNAMGNVTKWENRIMRQISPVQLDRNSYFWPPGFKDFKSYSRAGGM